MIFIWKCKNAFGPHAGKNIKNSKWYLSESVRMQTGSLSVGHSESRRMTDEIGISPERPIHFECN